MRSEWRRFTGSVRRISDVADIILVANVKDPGLLKIDSVHASVMLQRETGVEAAPVVTIRDFNRAEFLSTMLAVFASGLKSVMVAWGDDFAKGVRASNVRDYPDLAGAIREAAQVRSRVGSDTLILAPVDLRTLGTRAGAARARSRLAAGAGLLLAQPPTTDSQGSFLNHTSLAEKAGLGGRVLLGVFPFKSESDLTRYERLFGWALPADIHEEAKGGEGRLLEVERDVVRRIRRKGLPGVYLSTRGDPGVARALLS